MIFLKDKSTDDKLSNKIDIYIVNDDATPLIKPRSNQSQDSIHNKQTSTSVVDVIDIIAKFAFDQNIISMQLIDLQSLIINQAFDDNKITDNIFLSKDEKIKFIILWRFIKTSL